MKVFSDEQGHLTVTNGNINAGLDGPEGRVWIMGTAGDPPRAAGFDAGDLERLIDALQKIKQLAAGSDEYVDERRTGPGYSE